MSVATRGGIPRRRKHSASQTDEDEHVSKTHEISPEQASADIDKEFVDRRVWERHPGDSHADTQGR